MMPRVSKVILGAHAVLANGGLLGEAGCAMTALAARNSSTPIMVCSGVYKICPHWEWAAASGSDGGVGGLRLGDGSGTSLNLVVAGVSFTHPPSQVLSFNDNAVGADVIENTEVVSPMLEYVSPQHVDVYITNVGDFPPSYIYRLIKENYHEDDLRPVA
jgi:translation initiation factor eIF-2B subunit beta